MDCNSEDSNLDRHEHDKRWTSSSQRTVQPSIKILQYGCDYLSKRFMGGIPDKDVAVLPLCISSKAVEYRQEGDLLLHPRVAATDVVDRSA